MLKRHIRRLARSLAYAAVAAVAAVALILLVDRPLARYCDQHAHAIHDAIGTVSALGEAAWYLVPSLLVFLIARFIVRRPEIAARGLFVFLGVAFAGLASDVLKFVVGRSRPWVLLTSGGYGLWPLQLNADYQSFPSGHAACVAAAALTLAVIVPRYRGQLFLAGSLIALTRVVALAHYLSDVIAGAALAWLVVVILQRAFARHGVPLGPASRAAAGVPLGPAGGAAIAVLPSPFAQRVFGAGP